MRRLSTIYRISIGVTLLTVTVLFAADFAGFLPNPAITKAEGRFELCEIITLSLCDVAQLDDTNALKARSEEILHRNPDLLSIGVRKLDGDLLYATDDHRSLWSDNGSDRSPTTHIEVPIAHGETPWGSLELGFRPIVAQSRFAFLAYPSVRLCLFVVLVGGFTYTVYLRRVLRHLDPSAVIPERVKAALNTLSEGLLVLDSANRIVLANDAFSRVTGIQEDTLLGKNASDMNWIDHKAKDDQRQSNTPFPWELAVNLRAAQTGAYLRLMTANKEVRTFVVNASPILGAGEDQRGSMATFDDVTPVEKKNEQLKAALQQLQDTRRQIESQNEKLRVQATQDPLTDCMNRRAFFAAFEQQWASVDRYGGALGCVMLDIDHFKSVNDQHGHQMGDQVLERVAHILRSQVRITDIVCRYGGEEFCILLPETDAQGSSETAEKLRSTIESSRPGGLRVTCSLGVSSREFGSDSPQALIDEADKALYAAKRGGRNRVIRWDAVSGADNLTVYARPGVEASEDSAQASIPYSAVSALTTALRHRDPDTCAHAHRVADLCVMTLQGLLSPHDCFIMEIAGLLHDIGKIGVPDAILLKPGPLTEAEWEVMSLHDRLGVEIIDAAFSSRELTNIVRFHHAFFDGNSRDPGLPRGRDIPIRARVLSIADAFDAMVSKRVYRGPMPRDEAFAELRRCAGSQFDPDLVEHFISCYGAREEHQASIPASESLHIGIWIGLEAEHLLAALDANDFTCLMAMTERLAVAAKKLDLPHICRLAAELSTMASGELEPEPLVRKTRDLLELCHDAQKRAISVRKAASGGTVSRN